MLPERSTKKIYIELPEGILSILPYCKDSNNLTFDKKRGILRIPAVLRGIGETMCLGIDVLEPEEEVFGNIRFVWQSL